MKGSRKIVTLQTLSKLTHTSRTILYGYLHSKRIHPEFIDEYGRMYWTRETARRIGEAFTAARRRYTGRSRGNRLITDPLLLDSPATDSHGQEAPDNQGRQDSQETGSIDRSNDNE